MKWEVGRRQASLLEKRCAGSAVQAACILSVHTQALYLTDGVVEWSPARAGQRPAKHRARRLQASLDTSEADRLGAPICEPPI